MNEWRIVYTTSNVTEAHIVAGRLETEGIHALVHQQAGAGALGITVGALGEVVVLVSPDAYERALDVLQPPEPEELVDNTDAIIYRWDDDDESDAD